MTAQETIIVQVAQRPERVEPCEIILAKGYPVKLEARSRLFGSLTFTSDDLFGALVELRLRLEQNGYVLLCNAARKDAYPSRMGREMGGGRKVYLHKLGAHGRREDLVDALGAAAYDQVSTVDQQRSFYDAWLGSLK